MNKHLTFILENTGKGQCWMKRRVPRARRVILLSISSVWTRWMPDRNPRGNQGVPSCDMMPCSLTGRHVLCVHSWPAYASPSVLAMDSRRVLEPVNCPWIPAQLNEVEKLRTGAAVIIQVFCFLPSHPRKTQWRYLREPAKSCFLGHGDPLIIITLLGAPPSGVFSPTPRPMGLIVNKLYSTLFFLKPVSDN